MLAHKLGLDLSLKRVPEDEIIKIRQLDGIPRYRHTYVDGQAQQFIADHLDQGYIIVCPAERVAAQYTANCRDPNELLWALLVQYNPHHTEPLATKGGRVCGLLTYSEAQTFLQGYEVCRQGGILYRGLWPCGGG